MNNESINCRKVEFGKIEKVGDFTFDAEFTHIYVWLPGVSGPDCIEIRSGLPGGDRVLGWDGNKDLPSIFPSILVRDQWHGFLKEGKLISC